MGYNGFALLVCGKTGIRTLGTRKGTTVFETVPIDHSGIFPKELFLIASAKLYIFFRSAKYFRLFLSLHIKKRAKTNGLRTFLVIRFYQFLDLDCPNCIDNTASPGTRPSGISSALSTATTGIRIMQ